MSNSSFFGSIKKSTHFKISSLVNIFSNSDAKHSHAQPASSSQQVLANNAFKYGRRSKPKYQMLLAQKEVILKLISLYREHECLWNPSCSEYKNTAAHKEIWQNIANVVDGRIPAEDIKQKVFALRKVWEKETSLVHASFLDKNSKVYLPKLFYYSHFEFLNQVTETAPPMDDLSKEGAESPMSSNIDVAVPTELNLEIGDFKRSTSDETEHVTPSDDLTNVNVGHSDLALCNQLSSSPIEPEPFNFNKTEQLNNLCEIIKSDLQHVSPSVFFEAKWQILDVLRSAEFKQLLSCGHLIDVDGLKADREKCPLHEKCLTDLPSQPLTPHQHSTMELKLKASEHHRASTTL